LGTTTTEYDPAGFATVTLSDDEELEADDPAALPPEYTYRSKLLLEEPHEIDTRSAPVWVAQYDDVAATDTVK
jgi:hypothetical protein